MKGSQQPSIAARRIRRWTAGFVLAGLLIVLPAGPTQASQPGGIVAGSLSAGLNHTCAIKTDGTVSCWGDNTSGQLTGVPSATFTAISAGANHTCGIKTDGTLSCWGNNTSSQLTGIPAGIFTALS